MNIFDWHNFYCVPAAGLHIGHVWRKGGGGHRQQARVDLGPSQHGLLSQPKARLQPQVPDALHTMLPQQTGQGGKFKYERYYSSTYGSFIGIVL